MKHSYYNPTNAWRWVLVLYRLANVPADQPMRISPKTAVATARMRLFCGRMYVLDSGDSIFAPFQAPSMRTAISAERDYLLIKRQADYQPPAEHGTFRLAYEFITGFVKSNEAKANLILPAPLLTQQVTVLAEFIGNIQTIQPALVTCNQIVITK